MFPQEDGVGVMEQFPSLSQFPSALKFSIPNPGFTLWSVALRSHLVEVLLFSSIILETQ